MKRNALIALAFAALLLATPACFHAEASAAAPVAAASTPEGAAPHEPAPAHEAAAPANAAIPGGGFDETTKQKEDRVQHGEAAGHEAAGAEHEGGHEAHHVDKIWGVDANIWTAINLILLLSILGYLLKGGMKKFFADRASGIKAQLEEATNAKAEAEGRLKELQTRMDALSGEVETLRNEAAQAADKLKAQILQEAGEEAARLRQQAMDEIAAAEREARVRLQAAAAQEASQLALQLAGAKLQGEDHDRLVDGLADSLSEVPRG